MAEGCGDRGWAGGISKGQPTFPKAWRPPDRKEPAHGAGGGLWHHIKSRRSSDSPLGHPKRVPSFTIPVPPGEAEAEVQCPKPVSTLSSPSLPALPRAAHTLPYQGLPGQGYPSSILTSPGTR